MYHLPKNTQCLRRKCIAKYLLILLLIFIDTGRAWAQAEPVSVQGVVLDESGETLIGVSVLEKGTTNGVITDVDGKFIINVQSSKSVLQFSYVGYASLERQATVASMKVTMKVQSELLDEVVVVAYGTQKKTTVTGSVAAIKSDEIMKSNAPTLEAAIAGKIPGLTSIQGSGEPGQDGSTMYLRGISTVNGASPLILVDGIPRSSIREIDSNEIASLSVLKDASATAVFGVRGANGVILITTKRGEKGKMVVKPSVSYSMQSFSRKPKHMDSGIYANLLNETRANEGVAPMFSPEEVALFESWSHGGPESEDDRYWYPNTNWQNIMFKDHSSMVRANVDISGGTDRLQYFVNAGYLYQGGMFNTESKKKLGYDPQSKLNRYNFRSNIDYTFSKHVKASIDLSSYIEKANRTNGVQDAMWADALTARPTSPGPVTSSEYMYYSTDGFIRAKDDMVLYDKDQTANSCFGQLNRTGYNTSTRSGVNAVGTLNVDLDFITPGLSVKGIVSFESRSIATVFGKKSFAMYIFERDKTALGVPYYKLNDDEETDTPISMSRDSNNRWFLNAQAQVNYNRILADKHSLSGLLLFQRDMEERTGADLEYNMIGMSARATYAFDSRYLAEVNLGYNGSEQFAPGNRFGFFPAFSVGWLLTNESFLKGQNILSNLKLRASYGKVGNDKMGSARFLYLDNIKVSGSDYHYWGLPSLGSNGKINEGLLGNTSLSWEIAWKQNYGIDLGLFKNLNFTFDFFKEKRSDILINRNSVPEIGGLDGGQLPKVNMGKVDNHGYEITMNYIQPINKNLLVNLYGNFSYSSNQVKEYDELMMSEDYAYRYRTTGYSVGQQWGYKIDHSVDPATGRDGSGFFNSKEDIENCGLVYKIGKPLPGDFIYQDLNQDGEISEKDMAPIGYSNLAPKINYGFGLSVDAYGVDFSIMFQGVGKFSGYYQGWCIFEEAGAKSFTDMHMNRWSEERYAAGETITHPRLANSVSTSHQRNDYYIFDRSFLRLKNIELGYTLPADWSKKVGVKNIRFYMSGDNLFVWSHMPTESFDPEQASAISYPLNKSLTFGLNLQF